MKNILRITILGIMRDRVFHGITVAALVFGLVPVISQLSMRQVTELALTLSLSLTSFLLLLLSVFLGGMSLWKDIDRRYAFSILGLPLQRSEYVLGKYLGVVSFILLTATVLGIVGAFFSYSAIGVYPPNRPVLWENYVYAIFFDVLKYALLVGFAFLFSTISTSFFLPMFGAVCIFFVGSSSQEAYNYVNSPEAEALHPAAKSAITALYYVLPNFGAFDFKTNAIYSIPMDYQGLMLTFVYFCCYVSIILGLAVILFNHRQL
jgi:ABC-type transport system involved in multi-copper enzyme maturation permease subunit